MRMPARRFRECMEVQVTIRSPIPAKPPKVCREPPSFSPKRVLSAIARVISRALVLS